MIFIHPSSDVQSANIGDGTKIWQNSVVLASAKIGCNCNLNFNTFVENDVEIGDYVTLKSGVYLWDGIKVKNNVFIGPNATFVNNQSPRSQVYPNRHIGCIINEGASIGANATIMGNLVIGSYSMIGAGSVLTKNTGNFELWYGNPAVHKGFVTKDGTILSLDLLDKFGLKYKIENNEILKV